MATTGKMIEITTETKLTGKAEAFRDALGSLTVIQDSTLPEAEQQFVHLDADATRKLLAFLLSPNM